MNVELRIFHTVILYIARVWLFHTYFICTINAAPSIKLDHMKYMYNLVEGVIHIYCTLITF